MLRGDLAGLLGAIGLDPAVPEPFGRVDHPLILQGRDRRALFGDAAQDGIGQTAEPARLRVLAHLKHRQVDDGVRR